MKTMQILKPKFLMKFPLKMFSLAGRAIDRDISRNYSYLMLYMKVVTLSGLSIKKLFSVLGRAEGIIGYSSRLFRKLDILVNKWGYKSTKALRYVADGIRHRDLKGLLYRMAYSISIGVPVKEFANIEYQKYVLQEEREILQRMDRLRVYCEAYSAILNANILIAVITVVVGMMFGTADPTSTLIGALCAITGSILGILILFKITAPSKGSVLHNAKPMPPDLKSLLMMAKPSIATFTGTIIGPTILAAHLVSGLPSTEMQLNILLNHVLPITYGVAGATLLVIGWLGNRKVNKVNTLDQLYMIFIKTLGEATVISGSLREGVRRIVHNDYKELNPYVKRLFNRLRIGVEVDVAWRSFSVETGSNIIYRYSGIYVSAIKTGSPAIDTSALIHEAISRELVVRDRRNSIANYLKGMIIPLQAVFTTIFTLIAVLTSLFYRISRLVTTYITIISIPNPLLVVLFLFLGSLILTYGNSIAIYILKGDSIFTLLYYLGLLSLISGFAYFLLSFGLSWLFEMFMGFERGMREIGIPS